MNFGDWLRSHAESPIADELLDTPLSALTIAAGDGERAWCDGCMTSAVLRIPLHGLAAWGVGVIGHVVWCTRCQPEGPL